MKIKSHFIYKENQHFDESDNNILKLLLKTSGGISSDSNGLYIDNNINRTATTDKYVVDSTIISNNYIDLTNTPHVNEHLFVIYNGLILEDGSGNDFQISGQRITFDASFTLTTGDRIVVKYKF